MSDFSRMKALQQIKILRVTQLDLVKKCLGMFSEIAEKKDEYTEFLEQLGLLAARGARDL